MLFMHYLQPRRKISLLCTLLLLTSFALSWQILMIRRSLLQNRGSNCRNSKTITWLSSTAACGDSVQRPCNMQKTIERLYDMPDPAMFSLHVTGGGVSAAQWLLSVPGASRCVLDVEVPYARSALSSFLSNFNPRGAAETSCSPGTALAMAKASFVKSTDIVLQELVETSKFNESMPTIFGVSCTAALVSGKPKKGSHRCHIAVHCAATSFLYSLQLEKGLRDRIGEDEECSKLIIDVLAHHMSVPVRSDSRLLQQTTIIEERDASLLEYNSNHGDEVLHITSIRHNDALERIYTRDAKHALFFYKESSAATSGAAPDSIYEQFHIYEDALIPHGSVVYPGSFNPLHDGHLQLIASEIDRRRSIAADAGQEFKAPLIIFEIAAINADKPPLTREAILKRLDQFNSNTNPRLQHFGIKKFAVSVTSEPLFVAKGDIFRGCTFLIGADTMTRLLNPKYYSDDSL